MTITAYAGPVVVYGQTQTSTGGITEYNPQAGPSLFYQGVALVDYRAPFAYQNGAAAATPIYGWFGCDDIMVIDQVPTTAGENSIALTQSATTTTTRTLTLTTSNTANVTINQSIVRADTGATVTGLLAIDSKMATVTFGSDAAVNLWSPATSISRCVRIEGSSNDGAGGFTINGYDIYGYPMTETLAGSISTTTGSTFVVTQKAFKYISTITASGTINSTGVTIGVADIYGFPLAVTNGNRTVIGISSGTSFNTVTTSTGIVAASTAATQTSTTPDVRGTWSSTTAADGTRRFTVYVSPSVTTLGSTGLFGGTQA